MTEEALAAPTRWDRAFKWADRQSERLNAILIREVRRALNGRFFVSAFLVLLVLCVLTSLSAVFSAEAEGAAGWRVFSFLFLSLCGVTFAGLPLMISGLVHSEIKEKTLELLSITTVTAARIVWGEILTALGLFVLLASAVAPFMAFSYLLGGVDLRTIASGLGYAFLVSMLLTLLAILGSVQKTGGVVVRVGLLLAAFAAFGTSIGLINDWERPLETMWDWPEFMYALSYMLAAYVTVAAVFFTGAMARLTFATANRSGPVRLAVAAHLVVLGALGFWEIHAELWLTWAIYSMSVLFLLGIGVIGEEEELSQRQRRVGRLASLFPTFWSFFLPGAGRGLAFMYVLGVLVAGVSFVAMGLDRSSWISRYMEDSFLYVPWILLAYLILYLSITHALCTFIPSLGRPMVRRIVLLSLFAFTLILPAIFVLTLTLDLDESPGLAVCNPLTYLPVILDSPRDFRNASACTIGLLAVGALALVASLFPLGRSLLAARRSLTRARAGAA